MATTKVLLAYIPVWHEGYRQFLQKQAENGIRTLWLLGDEFIKKVTVVALEIRALPVLEMFSLLRQQPYPFTIEVLNERSIDRIKGSRIIAVQDALLERFVEGYLPHEKIEWDSAFLRWDEKNVLSLHDVRYDSESTDKFDREMMTLAQEESQKSSCWWRQVGAVVTQGDQKLFARYNDHVPSPQIHYIEGDPRDSIAAGERTDLATVFHSEQAVIAHAARQGISLEGASIYLTVFPCPVCAKMIAYSGFKKVFFGSGHASLDGERILKTQGIEIILVK